MVGWFDAVEKGNALRFGGFEYLVINKLDALSSTNEEFNEIKICIGYENTDGQKYLPYQDEKKHKELKPIYEKLPVWTEDISDCKKFEQLLQMLKIMSQKCFKLFALMHMEKIGSNISFQSYFSSE